MELFVRLNLIYAFLAIVTLSATQTFSQTVPEPIKAYEEAWKEGNHENRLSIIKSFWTEESVFEDPANNLKGVDALKNTIDKFWQDFPGTTSEIGLVLSQGNYHTWTWSIFDREKKLMLKGVDVAITNDKGQIVRLVGFWPTQK
jgi:hypothetical protein